LWSSKSFLAACDLLSNPQFVKSLVFGDHSHSSSFYSRVCILIALNIILRFYTRQSCLYISFKIGEAINNYLLLHLDNYKPLSSFDLNRLGFDFINLFCNVRLISLTPTAVALPDDRRDIDIRIILNDNVPIDFYFDPSLLPMFIPPISWSPLVSGGYLSNAK